MGWEPIAKPQSLQERNSDYKQGKLIEHCMTLETVDQSASTWD